MKKRILHFIGDQMIRAAAIVIMLALTVGSMMYLRGYFDLSFVDRVSLNPATEETQTDDTDTVDTEDVTSPVTPETEPAESDTAELPPENDPADRTDQNPNSGSTQTATQKETAKSVSDALKSAKTLQSQGYSTQTEGIYQRGRSVLAKLPLSGLGKDFSYSTYEVRDVQTTEYERGCIVTEEILVTEDRPAVTLRNGYIIRDVNGKLSLLKPDGTTQLSDYDESDFRLTELRDENGNALFAAVKRVKQEVLVPIMTTQENSGRPIESGFYEEEPVTQEVEELTYYILQDGKWVVSTYNDEFPPAQTDLGLQFDSPLDYGESDCDIVRYYEYGNWGYKNAKTGQVLIFPRYQRAYNFHDGYAIAFDWYGMHFISESGKTVATIRCEDPINFYTEVEVTLPDTDGIEMLGTYYFSHGLTRIRFRENQKSYKVWHYIKADDRSILYDVNGKEFPLPTGYSLEAYSDGILLLKNNDTGLYGCMNYKNEWIVQPQYSYVTPSLSGMIVVGDENGKKGLCDTNGSWILPQVFDYLSAPSQGMVAAYDKTVGWQVFRMMSK